jgi:hypothetical protein
MNIANHCSWESLPTLDFNGSPGASDRAEDSGDEEFAESIDGELDSAAEQPPQSARAGSATIVKNRETVRRNLVKRIAVRVVGLRGGRRREPDRRQPRVSSAAMPYPYPKSVVEGKWNIRRGAPSSVFETTDAPPSPLDEFDGVKVPATAPNCRLGRGFRNFMGCK